MAAGGVARRGGGQPNRCTCPDGIRLAEYVSGGAVGMLCAAMAAHGATGWLSWRSVVRDVRAGQRVRT